MNYKKYEDMINKISHWHNKHNRTAGITFEDIKSQGNLIYCECVEKYDKHKSKFSTYLHICLYRKLNNYIKKERKQIQLKKELIKIKRSYYISNVFRFFTMTDEMNEVVSVILNLNQGIFCAGKIYKKISKLMIKRILWSRGWSDARIKSSFQEIKLNLLEER